ncbi:hypothetical protein B0T24DRAFT_598318 [Lasiosphaeria ovina]|uniref:Uncharacterized protein n=1 Tax=Lasiosphaeria ovina TaxID=92902 RepID=A0AAE0JV97_9PEZI|nr:hypothetical protein B0T24DRAFT_598318 [Lasiosphaeria ovina]
MDCSSGRETTLPPPSSPAPAPAPLRPKSPPSCSSSGGGFVSATLRGWWPVVTIDREPAQLDRSTFVGNHVYKAITRYSTVKQAALLIFFSVFAFAFCRICCCFRATICAPYHYWEAATAFAAWAALVRSDDELWVFADGSMRDVPQMPVLPQSGGVDDGCWSNATPGRDGGDNLYLAKIRHIYLHNSVTSPIDLHHLLHNAPNLETLYMTPRPEWDMDYGLFEQCEEIARRLSSPEDFKSFRKQIRNILDWGKGTRLEQIKEESFRGRQRNPANPTAIR